MKRLILSLTVSLISVRLALCASHIVGYLQEGPVARAEVDASSFATTYRAQAMPEWCWAASIANVFAFYGHQVSQQAIVTQVYGAAVNRPALTGAVIAAQVNRVWTDDNGNRFRARLTAAYDFDAHVFAINNQFIINELIHDRPLLFGNTNHCMVVTAVDYSPYRVLGVGVFDPWPTSGGARNLAPTEMMPMNQGGQMRFLAALTVTDLR
jgi:hypothetical protein